MKVITVINIKGGAGKSTICAHLAEEASIDGLRTCILDIDPQGSLEQWHMTRTKQDIDMPDIHVTSKNLKDVVASLSDSGYDLCIIDTPGSDSTLLDASVMVAHRVLIPIRASAFDLSMVAKTVAIPLTVEIPVLFLINQSGAHDIDIDTESVREWLIKENRGKVLDVTVKTRKSYARAISSGTSARYTDEKAKVEMSGVFAQVKTELGLKSSVSSARETKED